MKTYGLLIILPIATLTGCSRWERPGANDVARQADYAACEARGFDRFPPDVVRDIEFDYGDKYVTCEKKQENLPERLSLRAATVVAYGAKRSQPGCPHGNYRRLHVRQRLARKNLLLATVVIHAWSLFVVTVRHTGFRPGFIFFVWLVFRRC
ncbi:Uncharacterised protein [Serratia odorifera]|uniref:Lipoprotein n=1 Tax=Serratia odorifera TaxID=618 RepID=A0A447L114_SEROD|nr:hypothetical protein [Serratia odorifera]VDZ64481.1 Uncharacterised protein [Serratia odorifera]